MAQIQIRRLGYALGASVTGIDLRSPLDEAIVATLRRAWLEHLVLCFPNQDVSKDQFVTFAGYFGEYDSASYMSPGDAENPQMRLLTNRGANGRLGESYKEGQTWHTDLSQTVAPALATVALAKELPEVGGDTLYANQYMAYDSLSQRMKDLIEGLSLLHDAAYAAGRNMPPELIEAYSRKNPPVVRPVVRTHPETGRKALYVGKGLRTFLGMTEEESKPIIDFLNQHAVLYEFTYRHRWSLHDVVIWDNRCLLHRAPLDYDVKTQPRTLWRCGLRGEVWGRLYDEAIAAVSA